MKYDAYGQTGSGSARVVSGGARRSPGRDGRTERRVSERLAPPRVVPRAR